MDLIVKNEKKTIKEIQKLYPMRMNIPIVNDEADPMKGWWRNEEWQAGVEYPIFVAENIDNHKSIQQEWQAGVEYPIFVAENIDNHKSMYFDKKTEAIFLLLSNDNAFLSYAPTQFTQRTLLARIQESNSSYTNSLFIKKPIFNFMVLQSHREDFFGDMMESFSAVLPDPEDFNLFCTLRDVGWTWNRKQIVKYPSKTKLHSVLSHIDGQWFNITKTSMRM